MDTANETICKYSADFDDVVERRPAVIELVETERNFIKTLKTIQDPFFKTLTPYLSDDDQEFAVILEELLAAHSSFCENLISSKSVATIMSLFNGWDDQMIIHSKYLFQLPRMKLSIDKLCDTDKLLNKQILKDVQRLKLLSLTNDLLQRPFQRFLKYKLFVEKILERTPREDPLERGIYKLGQEAIDILEDMSQYLNDVCKNHDELQSFSNAIACITNWPEQSYLRMEIFGIFLHKGELLIQLPEQSSPKYHCVFLFSRKLIFCDLVTPVSIHYARELDLSLFLLQDVKESSKLVPNWIHKWVLVKHTGKTILNIQHVPDKIEIRAKTSEHKKEWLLKFQQAMKSINPSEAKHTSHDIEIFCPASPTRCSRCQKLLRGSYPQGYRCRTCNETLHRSCVGIHRTCSKTANLDQHKWFAGEMTREESENALKDMPSGTFLVRYKPTHNNRLSLGLQSKIYAISVKCALTVRHIKVQQEASDSRFYLSLNQKFSSLDALVEWYKGKNLRECFNPRLDATLSKPWRSFFNQ